MGAAFLLVACMLTCSTLALGETEEEAVPGTEPKPSSDLPERHLNAAVVTGGHAYDQKAFPPLFEGHDGIDFTFEAQKDHSELFEDIENWPYDVIVFYSMTQEISEKRRKNFQVLLDRGVGIVALHHTFGAFPAWPEFADIIGVRYTFEEVTMDSVTHAPSTYRHDVDFTVQIEDDSHPITRGLEDFEIHDETYKGCLFKADNHALLTTKHAASDPVIGWTRSYRNARICTIQPGHGSGIFADATYRELVARAVRWVGQRGLKE